MGLSFRILRPWAPLFAALSLSAPAAERAAAASGGVPSDRSSAKALALLAQGLCFSAASEDDEAEWAFLQAVEFDPSLFPAREGLAEQQRRRGLPRTAVRTLVEGARATNRREDWRRAVRAAMEFAFSPPDEVGLDVALTDRQTFREAVGGLAAASGELSAQDEALLSASALRFGDLREAVFRFREHLRKLPPGAAPSAPLFALLMKEVCSEPSFLHPAAERGPTAASLAEAMMAAAPVWNRPETAKLVVRSIPDMSVPEMAGLALSLLPEIQRMDPGSSLPSLGYALGRLDPESVPRSDEGLRALFLETEAPNPEVAFQLRLLAADASRRMGRTEEALADLDFARGVWAEARPGEPAPAAFAAALAGIHWSAGDTNAAIRAYEAGLADHPSDPTLNNDLAYLLAEANEQLDRALALADTALSAQPLEAAYLDTLGWILHRQGREQEALDTFRKSLSLAPEGDPEIFQHVAAVLEAIGRPDEAAKWLRRAEKGDLGEDETPNER